MKTIIPGYDVDVFFIAGIAVEQRTHTPIKRSGFELQRLSVYLHIVIASQNRAASTEGRGRDLALRLLDDC